ncbi:unnamed protein product [Adineta ricciae]|uniref:Uncharacterized protein n=1 Tax=Adineta ricciae TaxID=249248 RepID=A0A815REL3_ADIRI|nr:unnamed protein product [Adineta ricciae]
MQYAFRYKSNSQLQRIRFFVLFLITTNLLLRLLFIVNPLFFMFHQTTRESYTIRVFSGFTSFDEISTIFALFYSIIFLIFVVKYKRTGILNCAWIQILELVSVFIRITRFLYYQKYSFFAKELLAREYAMITGIALTYCILTLLTFIFTLKVTKLMKNSDVVYNANAVSILV